MCFKASLAHNFGIADLKDEFNCEQDARTRSNSLPDDCLTAENSSSRYSRLAFLIHLVQMFLGEMPALTVEQCKIQRLNTRMAMILSL